MAPYGHPRALPHAERSVLGRLTVAWPDGEQELHLERFESLASLPGEWEKLAEAGGNIFGTREWLSTWWQHFGANKELFLVACRTESGRLVAILPLYRFAAWPLSVVRFIGHGPGDELGPICAPADRSQAARVLWRVIEEIRPDVFLGEHLPGPAYAEGLPGRVLRREASPVLEFRGSWEEYLATRSANLRQQTRRRERRLLREHAAEFRLSQDADRIEDDLHTLVGLHAARWGTESSTFSGRYQSFQRDFAHRALVKGWLRLWLVEIEGKAAAAWYGFRYGMIESYYQAGMDPRWRESGVGTTLLTHSIRAALDDGIEEYRFLRGGEAFKYRYASRETMLCTIGLGGTAIGRAAVAAAAAAPTDLATRVLQLVGRRARR